MRLRNVLIVLAVAAIGALIFFAWRETRCTEPQQRATPAAPGVAPGTRVTILGGKGSTLLAVSNNTSASVPVSLSSGPVTDAATGTEIPGAAVSFMTETGKQALPNLSAQSSQGGGTNQPTGGTPGKDTQAPPKPAPAVTVPAHDSLGVVANLTGVSGTGWAKVKIFNQATEIATLDAVVVDDQLNVAIDGLGSAAATPLPIKAGQTVNLMLKNNSAETLAVNCSAEVRDTSTACGRIVLLPNGSKSVALPLLCSAFRWTDWVQPTAVLGSVKLSTDVPPGTPQEMTPVKSVALSLTMQGAGPIGEPILSTVYVMVFLLIGGLLSILSSSVLPTWVRKAEVRKQVDELASRTANISQNVDSYLRVLLRLERKKIDLQLNNVSAVSFTTSAADQLTEISNSIAPLMRRLVAAERLDDLRRQFEVKSATAPPSITDQIDKNLDTAAGQLHSFVLNDADVDAAKGYLDKAQGLLNLLEDNDAQARLIAQNYMQLRNRLRAFPCDYYKDLRQALRGIFESLRLLDFCKDEGDTPKPVDGNHAGNVGNGGKTGDAGFAAGAGDVGNTNNSGAGGDGSKSVQAGSAGATAPGANSAPPGPGNQASPPNPANPQEGDVSQGTTAGQTAAGGGKPAGAEDAGGQGNGGNAGAGDPAGQAEAGSDDPTDFSNPKNIFPPMFFAIDHGIAAIQAVLDYAIVRRSVASGDSDSCQNPGQEAMERLKKHECDLLRLLGTLSWKSLRAAITLVQQMREDIYEEDVFDHFKKSIGKQGTGALAKVVFDTQRARPYQPVFFSIEFMDNRLNGAAALNWVTLNWDFPNDLHEKGWKVCHFFEGKEGTPAEKPKAGRTAAVSSGGTVTAQILSGENASRTSPNPQDATGLGADMDGGSKRNVKVMVTASSPRFEEIELPGYIEVQRVRPKGEKAGILADKLRFAIAFGVALVALQAGALDQLAKLGFVQATFGIIAAGFGADMVKNLLTQSSKPQTPATPAPPATKPGS